MINVSTSAASKITELLAEEQKQNSGLRVFVQGGGCSGFQYGLMIEENGGDFRGNYLRIIGHPIQLVQFDAVGGIRLPPQRSAVEERKYFGIPVFVLTSCVIEVRRKAVHHRGVVLLLVLAIIQLDLPVTSLVIQQ